MGCGQGAINSSCSSRQDFCTLSKQKVSQNSGITSSLNITVGATATAASWNRVYTVLKNIYNYGNFGSRNPSLVNKNGEWKKNNTGWWYEFSDGTWPANAWIYENNNYYYFNSSGYMIYQQWLKIGSYWYYFYGNGAMARNTWIDNWYVDNGGVWIEGYTSGQTITHHAAPTATNVDTWKVTNVATGSSILPSLYNTAIGYITTGSTISKGSSVSKAIMDTFQTAINNYQLNSGRCNSCNTNCNTNAQYYGSGGCGSGESGGGCGNCMGACMSCQSACSQGYPMACSQG